MTTTEAGSRILAMLAEQHDLLRKVGELAVIQTRVIEDDESEQLVAVLQQRSMILGRAIALTKEIESRIAQLPANDPQRSLIGQRRKAVADLAQAIARTDREHTSSLVRRRDELARSLADMNAGRHAASAYAPTNGPVAPGFQDRRA